MSLNSRFGKVLTRIDDNHIVIADNLISMLPNDLIASQEQTANAFSDKWDQYDHETEDFKKLVALQKDWYLKLYGFDSEKALADYLTTCELVLDAGAGTCYKAAWFAELSPNTTVVAADISSSLNQAAKHYGHLENLLFIQSDIGNLPFFETSIFDYVSCDQVIHHTADPYKTFQELARITKPGKDMSVYVYRKKALPRELVDDHFREYSKELSHEQLMALSSQITELGQKLSAITDEIDFPDIPGLEIEGGRMTVQRFIYWNFLKCFWNDDLGHHNSLMTNYDWYSPSQAARYSEQEFKQWVSDTNLDIKHFHKELACYSGRFTKLAS